MTENTADCHHNGHGRHAGDEGCSCACHGMLGRESDFEPDSSPLTIRNAQLVTATVAINKIMVDKKQVTLAVFRQLIEERLIDDDGNLTGIPWGTVNYHPDKCGGDDSDHLHVVWQKGDLLRRSQIKARLWEARFYSESADDYIQALYCLNEHSNLPGWRRVRDEDGERSTEFQFDGMRCWTSSAELKWHSDHDQCATAEKRDEALQRVRADVAEEKQRRERIRGHWKALNDLPQLFIAV